MMQRREVVRISERPDLAPIVARWLWEAFGRGHGETLAASLERVVACQAERGPDQSFVLLQDGEPVGTAGFVHHDLDERPDLTPWLAGVYVVPAFRGRGLVHVLIRAVEEAAMTARIETLWLYTSAAEAIYRRAGWTTVELLDRPGRRTALMRRDLGRPV